MTKLKPHETIVTAWAEHCYGPGWANAPVWVIVRDGNGNLRQEVIQPDEQSAEMVELHGIDAIVSSKMTGYVRNLMGKKRKRTISRDFTR